MVFLMGPTNYIRLGVDNRGIGILLFKGIFAELGRYKYIEAAESLETFVL